MFEEEDEETLVMLTFVGVEMESVGGSMRSLMIIGVLLLDV